MKTACLIAFLLSTCLVRAQDTIVYKNALKVPVILKEISPTEIRYKRPGMTDGPDYVIGRSEIDRIIYQNGTTEVFQTTPTVEPKINTEVQAVTDYQRKITYRDAKKRYSYMKQLVMYHPDQKRQPDLSQLALDIRQHKNIQDGTRTGAIVCGGLAIGGTFLYGLSLISGRSEPIFYVPPAVLGGMALALGSVSVVYNIRLRDKRKDFVSLYNE